MIEKKTATGTKVQDHGKDRSGTWDIEGMSIAMGGNGFGVMRSQSTLAAASPHIVEKDSRPLLLKYSS